MSAAPGMTPATGGPAGAGGAVAAALPDRRPPRAALVLGVLILGAIVANINTSISNVALPDIGRALNASNQQLTLITDAYQIAIASTVMYLGALGDRHGRKRLLVLGALLAMPFSILSAFSHSPIQLVLAQMATGVAGGMLYPTTLSLISALFSGRTMTRAIGLWAGVGAGASVLGPLAGGFLLEHFWWGSVFLITVPFAAVVLIVGLLVVPRHSGEGTSKVDHRGGVLSMLAVSSFVLMVVMLPHGVTPTVIVLLVVAAVAGSFFFVRERRAENPLFDLHLAAVPTFWVAFTAGIVAFGALVGALFIGQQFTQNVLGFAPFKAATMTIAMAVTMLVFASVAARLIERVGTRVTMALGLGVIALGFAEIVAWWRPGVSIPFVVLGYAVLGMGIGLAGTPSSHSLTASLPVRRAGMGSASADLTKDMGGAIFQAILGTLLTIAYSHFFVDAFRGLPQQQAAALGKTAETEISSSFAGARAVAQQLSPQDADRLVAAASAAFTQGKTLAVGFALLAALGGMTLVLWKYPRRDVERADFARTARANTDYLAKAAAARSLAAAPDAASQGNRPSA